MKLNPKHSQYFSTGFRIQFLKYIYFPVESDLFIRILIFIAFGFGWILLLTEFFEFSKYLVVFLHRCVVCFHKIGISFLENELLFNFVYLQYLYIQRVQESNFLEKIPFENLQSVDLGYFYFLFVRTVKITFLDQ